MNAPSSAPATAGLEALRFGSGHTVRRIEDPTLVAGQGRYTDDLQREGLTHLVFVRSPHAHARILAVDTTEALALPGVLAVYTGAELAAAGVKPMPAPPPNFKRPDGTPAASAPRRALAHEVVRFVGEAVAAVVATTREAAVEAGEAVFIDYEVLPAVTDVHAATSEGAPQLCTQAPDNVAAEMRHGDAAACAAAFATAAHTVRLELLNQRLAPASIEPRVVMAEPEAATGRLLVTLSSQMPTAVRDGIANHLPGLTKEQVRVQVGDVGGGFGMKTGLYPEDLVVAHAARALQRPVRWRGQRLEEFTASVHGRDMFTRAELALDAQGRVLAMRHRSWANVGGYATPTGCAIPLVLGPFVATSVYDIPVIDFHISAVMTNTTPTGAYRGAGRPEAIYIVERLMDAAAQQMGTDPAELRRRNLVRPDQMPYTNAARQVYDCGEFEKMLDQGLALADWAGYAARAAQSTAAGRLRGRSVTTFLEWTGGNALSETVKVDVLASGLIELTTATMPMGQGIATSYAQLAVDTFGVPIDRIRIVQGDTDRATGFGSAGSRSLFTGGGA
ncbi:MAG: xanthine dehydrogenase family protein molybdopterin-binding subunit, partial [Rubrivivax sp.]